MTDPLLVRARIVGTLVLLFAPGFTGGTEDLWSDPVGEFKACVAASPIYELLGHFLQFADKYFQTALTR